MAVEEYAYEARRSALNSRVEVTVRPEHRRSWTSEQKLRIVQETLAPGAVVISIARRYGISTGLLYTWRRQLLAGAVSGFLPVEVTPEPVALPAPTTPPAPAGGISPSVVQAPSGLIEVELPSGIKLRVDGHVDEAALARVLTVLARQ
jgi:transposase